MKNFISLMILTVATAAFITMTSCSKDNSVTTVDSSLPDGKFTSQRMGTLTAQNGTPTSGTVEFGTDTKSQQWLHFTSNFKTELATGTVTIYLSKTQPIQFDPGNGNPKVRAVGIISKNGEGYFKINTSVDNTFNNVILWCGSASIPFGYAPLQ